MHSLLCRTRVMWRVMCMHRLFCCQQWRAGTVALDCSIAAYHLSWWSFVHSWLQMTLKVLSLNLIIFVKLQCWWLRYSVAPLRQNSILGVNERNLRCLASLLVMFHMFDLHTSVCWCRYAHFAVHAQPIHFALDVAHAALLLSLTLSSWARWYECELQAVYCNAYICVEISCADLQAWLDTVFTRGLDC